VRNLLERLQMIESEWRSRSTTAATVNVVTDPKLATTSMDVTIAFTPREKEVLALLAEGLSNVQIGDRLHLSPRTVEKHVSSLLNKTDTNNRSELLRFAVDHHLV